MGRGDRKTRRGKQYRHSYGKTRRRKTKKATQKTSERAK